MVSTRSAARPHATNITGLKTTPQQEPKVQEQTAAQSIPKIPTAAEQEQQLQADRAMIDVYRNAWKSKAGVSHTAWRHVRDVIWWLEHICGVNMLDYEEKVVVVCIFLAVLVLIALGAYKQSTQLVHLIKQLAMPGFS